MAGETQFTPEAAKSLVGVAANPEASITGTTTADLILKATAARQSAGQSEEALKVIAREALPHKKEDVERVIVWNLSSERDPTSQTKITPTNADESRRVNDSKTGDEAIRILVERGTINAAFRDKITTFLETNSPVVGDVIRTMRADGGDVNVFVEGLMKTPGFKKFAMELHSLRLDPTKRLSQEITVQNLELDIANLQAQLGTEVTQTQIDTARTELDTAKAALTPHTAEQIQLQTKTAQYQELTNEMSQIKKELRIYKGEGEPLATELSALEIERASLDSVTDAARISAIDTKTQAIRKNGKYLKYASLKGEMDQHASLVGEIAGLQISLEPFQQEITKKTDTLNALLEKQKSNITPQKKAEIEAQINQKRGQLADTKTQLEAEQMKFYRDATHIGEDAMEKYLNETLNGLKTIWKEEATKQASKDTTEEGKLASLAIDKAYNTLCKKTETKGNLTFFKPDKTKAKNILNEVFKAGGAENIALYLEGSTHATLGITAAEHTALKEKLKDPDFRKAQSEGLAKQALADYLIDGGRMNGDLVKSLATSDFGKTLLTEARAKVDTAMSQYKDQFGKGVFDNSTRFGEFLKSNKWWLIGPAILALLIALGFMAAR